MNFFDFRRGPVRTVERYCAACNRDDLDAVARLLADDVRLVDPAGEAVEGRGNVLEALRRLRRMVPDYRLDITEISAHGNQVYIRGQVRCSEPRLTGELLWRAVADDRRIREWQSYSPDGKPNLARITMPSCSPRRAWSVSWTGRSGTRCRACSARRGLVDGGRGLSQLRTHRRHRRAR